MRGVGERARLRTQTARMDARCGRASLRCSCCTMMAAAFSSALSRAVCSARNCSCSPITVACHATAARKARASHATAAVR